MPFINNEDLASKIAPVVYFNECNGVNYIKISDFLNLKEICCHSLLSLTISKHLLNDKYIIIYRINKNMKFNFFREYYFANYINFFKNYSLLICAPSVVNFYIYVKNQTPRTLKTGCNFFLYRLYLLGICTYYNLK